jgi:sugar/nucleoside kinase (ribokinase family)
MALSQPYDIVCVGNYTKDTIVSPNGTLYVDGGAVNYAAHAAVRLGFKVAVVTHLAQEDERMIDKLNESGVICYPVYTPSSTNMKLEYPTLNPDIRTLYVTGTAGTIAPEEVAGLDMRAAVIGTSLRGEVGLDVIQALRKKDLLLAADVQGFVRVLENSTLVYKPWEEMDAVLANLDILKSDAVEAEFLTGEKDIFKAAKFYADRGPKEIVLTHKDGVLIWANGRTYEEKFLTEKMNGRSGRGDTCLGTYVAMRLIKSPAIAGIWAAALTSMKMEKLGPFDRTIHDVEEFIRVKYPHAGHRQ